MSGGMPITEKFDAKAFPTERRSGQGDLEGVRREYDVSVRLASPAKADQMVRTGGPAGTGRTCAAVFAAGPAARRRDAGADIVGADDPPTDRARADLTSPSPRLT